MEARLVPDTGKKSLKHGIPYRKLLRLVARVFRKAHLPIGSGTRVGEARTSQAVIICDELNLIARLDGNVGIRLRLPRVRLNVPFILGWLFNMEG